MISNYEQGRKDERAKVVAWLRERFDFTGHKMYEETLLRIEAGEHDKEIP